MLQANVADFKNHLSEYLQKVESGETVEICKRNIPIAKVTLCPIHETNGTVLGCGKKTVKVNCDLTEPALDGWEMLKGHE